MIVRVSQKNPCPVCNHADWCGYDPETGRVLCMRVPSDRVASNGAYVHYLHLPDHKPSPPTSRLESMTDFNRLFHFLLSRTTEADYREWASDLGVPPDCLRRFQCVRTYRGMGAPMWQGRHVTGIRIRENGGAKYAMRGSREGIFRGPRREGPVLLCEGLSDTIVASVLGFMAIGKPSALSGDKWLSEPLTGRDVVMVGDRNDAGIRGVARTLVRQRHVKSIRVIYPPCRDLREWYYMLGADALADTIRGGIPASGVI